MSSASLDLRSLAPTLCQLMEVPTTIQVPVIGKLVDHTPINRCLIFAADALGTITHQQNPDRFGALYDVSQVTIDLQAMFPPITPVCFGSLFTGLSPEEHGITSYTKPILSVNTIFDDLIKTGKRVAIIAVEGSSIATIFGNRNLDYFLEQDDQAVLTRALSCLEEDTYDFLVVYQQEFDDTIHTTNPSTAEALAAINHHVEAYTTIVQHLHQLWRNLSWMSGFVTDHGTHIDKETGRGAHGLNIPDDMQTRHFFTFGK